MLMKLITWWDEFLIKKFQILLNYLQKFHYLSQIGYYRFFMFFSFIVTGLNYTIGGAKFSTVAMTALLILIIFTMQTLGNYEKNLDDSNTANFYRYSDSNRIIRTALLILLCVFVPISSIQKNELNFLQSATDILLIIAQYIIACDNLPKDKRKSLLENFKNLFIPKPKTVSAN